MDVKQFRLAGLRQGDACLVGIELDDLIPGAWLLAKLQDVIFLFDARRRVTF